MLTPRSFPPQLKASRMAWIDVDTGRGTALTLTCQFQLDEGKGTRRDFALACLIAMAATTACSVLPDRWFPPHFAVRTAFSITAWDATVEMARVFSPIWPACWVQCPDRSTRSSSDTLRNIWDVNIQELSFVPRNVRERLRAT